MTLKHRQLIRLQKHQTIDIYSDLKNGSGSDHKPQTSNQPSATEVEMTLKHRHLFRLQQ